ncbi:MAG: ribonuclease HII [Clostridia bacterium]|nr:ribonuclease HII [Clostridia bacterium]
MKPIKSIKEAVATMTLEEKLSYRATLLGDERKAVQAVVARIDKDKMAYDAEIRRTRELYALESEYRGRLVVAGVDEVGRGPLAGPVVTACVVLPEEEIFYLNDSKQIKEAKREELYDEIMAKAVAVGIGVVDNERIDEVNILNATKEAMKLAIENTGIKIDHLFIDAVTLESISIPQTSLIKGDERVASIAAASIVAKVTRDRMMVDYEMTYPGYDFAGNKGYGTAKHYEGLDQFGATSIHRMSFLKKYQTNKG